ncbi:MAG: Cna B-type domain-containing protein, partial [Oscillospiraceae bacterium]|nr:Cna B-type domain-containing protein [Oscillospiraceae bacterium]
EGEGDEGATFAVMRAAMPAATVEEDEREVEMLSNSPMAEYRNGLLIIRNSTDTTSVTVKKEWKCVSENWRPVTMQLMANGVPVTSLLSNVELTQVLDANNNWSATWGNLPLMANGAEIVWSVREIKIGDEACLSDYSFVNWLVSYSGATETYSDGRLVNTSFTVTNDTYRTLLYVVKTDLGGSIRLAGARFTLARMRNGAVDNSFTVREDVTDANGMITFDNLEHGDYCLTEVASPTGYDTMTAPIYLTIRSDGIVVVQAHDYAISGGTYTVQVLNEPLRPLPETGGSGPGWYYLLGALCMAAAAAAWCIRRREGGVSPP